MGYKEKLNILTMGKTNAILKGLLVTYSIGLILTLIFSLLFHFSPLSEYWLGPAGVITTVICLFFGGSSAAKAAGSGGLFHGLIVGIIFTLLMFLGSNIDTISWSSTFTKSILALFAASVGGIYGVDK